MGTLTIRNLPEEVIQGVKTSAELHKRSMEQEIRELLQRRYGPRVRSPSKNTQPLGVLPRTEANEIGNGDKKEDAEWLSIQWLSPTPC